MRPFRLAFCLLLSGAGLTGCLSADGALPNGVDPAAIAALNGGLVARNDAARDIPRTAKAYALSAEYQALQFAPADEEVTWDSGDYHGRIVPTQLYRVGTQDCRGYSHVIEGEGRTARSEGAACRNASGYWSPVT